MHCAAASRSCKQTTRRAKSRILCAHIMKLRMTKSRAHGLIPLCCWTTTRSISPRWEMKDSTRGQAEERCMRGRSKPGKTGWKKIFRATTPSSPPTVFPHRRECFEAGLSGSHKYISLCQAFGMNCVFGGCHLLICRYVGER